MAQVEHQIKLNDLLKLENTKSTKVRFHMYDGNNDPLELFLNDPETVNTQWTFWRTKTRFFNVGETVISLLRLSSDHWLLTTVKLVTRELDVLEGINYEGEELEHLSGYFGRVVVSFHKSFQSPRRFFDKISDELIVESVLPSIYDGDDFPGYDKVCISWDQLNVILNRNKQDWVAALKNQKAVYLLTDTHNGKLYVGSATSDKGMLLERWRAYSENGHGGNVELKELIDKREFDYIKQHFQFSILENYNQRTDDHVILERETWWKKTLASRQHGYNRN